MAALIPPDLEATLVLVRHGESAFLVEGRFQGGAETPLTPRGRRQADLLAARLSRPADSPALSIPSGAPVEIVHSPLGRTTETAEAIARAVAAPTGFGNSVPLRPDDGLREIGQGEWEGLHQDEVWARWGDTLATWRQRPLEAWAPGGEALVDVQARVRPSITRLVDRLVAAAPERRSDDDPPANRSPVAGYRPHQASGPWSVVVGHDGLFKILFLSLFDLPLDRFWMWSFDLCGVTIVELRGGRAVLRAVNLTEHLGPLLDAEAQALTEERQRSGAL
jgi:probable phosphoglycerate mutase